MGYVPRSILAKWTTKYLEKVRTLYRMEKARTLYRIRSHRMKRDIATVHAVAESQSRLRIDSSPDVFADADLAVVRGVGHELLQLLNTVATKVKRRQNIASRLLMLTGPHYCGGQLKTARSPRSDQLCVGG